MFTHLPGSPDRSLFLSALPYCTNPCTAFPRNAGRVALRREKGRKRPPMNGCRLLPPIDY